MPVSAAEYNRKLAQEQKRSGTSRDEAVRRTNIATGYGSSTAQRFMHEKPAAKKTDPVKTSSMAKPKASPFALPAKAPQPTPRPAGGDAWSQAVGSTPNPYASVNDAPFNADPRLAAVPPQLQPIREPFPSPTVLGGVPPDLQGPPSFTPPLSAGLTSPSVLRTVPPILQPGGPAAEQLGQAVGGQPRNTFASILAGRDVTGRAPGGGFRGPL